MAIYEGKWRCTFCQTVCRGRDMDCAGCGARRGADVEFFLDDDAPPVTDEALLLEANDGPDWRCETCGGSNRFNVQTCQTCGAPLGSSDFREVTDTYSDDVLGIEDDDAGGTPGQGATPPHDGEPLPFYKSDSHHSREYGAAGAGLLSGWTPSYTLIGIAAAGLIVLLTLLNLADGGGSVQRAFEPKVDPRYSISRNVELTVDRVEWKRSIVVEEYRDVVSEDWEGAVPSDARVISQRQDVHHHDRVKVGSHVVQEHYTERVKAGTRTVTETYTDRESSGTERYECGTRNRGNGYFETVYCTRPVYRTVTKTRSKQVDDYETVSRVRDKTVDDYKDVPVYRLKIKYSVKRWVPADTLAEEGTDLSPRWPEVVSGKAKRAGQRSETYRVFLRDLQNNKVYGRDVSAEAFASFTAGAKCAATVNGFDQIVALTPPAVSASR